MKGTAGIPVSESVGQPEWGLSEAEVHQRRQLGQTNHAPLPSSRPYRQIVRENLFTFVNGVFFALGLVMVRLNRYGDALLVVVIVFGGALVNVIQEILAKRQLDRIALLHRPQAHVMRAGRAQVVDPRDLVLGDVLEIRAGDQIVVDGRVIGEGSLEVDESLLTGESDRVHKKIGDPLYSGTLCVSGHTYGVAEQVGMNTVAYRLAAAARTWRQVLTPVQREINLIVRVFLLFACFLLILIGLSFLGQAQPLGDTVQRAAVVAGLVPTGLVLATVLAYGTGALRLLDHGILIQQANAVESLSHVDVLCLDKTGTLTCNQLQVVEHHLVGTAEDTIPLRYFLSHMSEVNGTIAALRQTFLTPDVEALAAEITVCEEMPFASQRRWSGLAWSTKERTESVTVGILAAPEVVEGSLSAQLQHTIHEAQSQGLRVVVFAYTQWPAIPCDWPQVLTQAQPHSVLILRDQLRPQVEMTLQSFAHVGVQIKVISGDHPDTVATLARQAGLGDGLKVLSGANLAALDPGQWPQAIEQTSVFGRINPEQKAEIIKSLRQHKHYVAMIGDGVNDVLALKQADLGIAMASGSQATRAVADLVLLEDSFASLPTAFREGQRISNGIRDVLALYLVRGSTIAILIMASAMVTDSFPFVNKHSALVALLAVGLPTIMLPLWAQPGSRRRGLLGSLLHFTLPAMLSIALVSLSVYLLYLLGAILNSPGGTELNQVNLGIPRTALVTILILCTVLLLPFLKPPSRCWVAGEPLSGDWRYTGLAGLLLAGYGLILGIPPLREFFELQPLQVSDLLFLVAVAVEWAFILRAMWRSRCLDRFLGVSLS